MYPGDADSISGTQNILIHNCINAGEQPEISTKRMHELLDHLVDSNSCL